MKINDEFHKEILKLHKKVKPIAKKAIEEYKKAFEKDEEGIYAEIAFCILTPQSKAKNAWSAISKLVENRLLFEGDAEEISEYLNVVRFKNNKAKYLVELRELMKINGKLDPKSILLKNDDVFEMRNWILKNVKGMGMKESSHVLRNLGFGEDIAILDRHILKNLALLGVINEVPKSLTEKKYLEIEENMKKYSMFSKIRMDELDLVLWYKETGEVFK